LVHHCQGFRSHLSLRLSRVRPILPRIFQFAIRLCSFFLLLRLW
jgi:hypothetical protein